MIEEAERILGHTFANKDLLRVALTHASIADTRLVSNERLEFLGDAVLGMLVCDYLYDRYTSLLEGELTKIKSAVVSRRMCARIAGELGLDRLLALGKGMKTRTALPSSLSAAVLESAIGAMYLDAGIERVRAFLMPHLAEHIAQAATSGHQQNFKSVLQQHAQSRMGAQPVYVLIAEQGPDHAKDFQVAVEIGQRRFPPCWAGSKKQAEQSAALTALEELGLMARDEHGHAVYVGHRLAEPADELAADLAAEAAADPSEAPTPPDPTPDPIAASQQPADTQSAA
ncbi:MAG: ribonuclease III [Phycisphaerales bacterium]|nr:ribonuclease III [Phycisphaerales bacterium]